MNGLLSPKTEPLFVELNAIHIGQQNQSIKGIQSCKMCPTINTFYHSATTAT